ncbi:MAG: hypothetical protein PHY28_04410 [Dehalococcoidales bacterium]|nr:hypothetical protein [Dehalococcoidales bacterium]
MNWKTWPFKPLDFSKFGGLSVYRWDKRYGARAMLRAGAEWGVCSDCHNLIPIYHKPERGRGTVCLICGLIFTRTNDYWPTVEANTAPM